MNIDSILFFRRFRARIILRLCIIGTILVATIITYARYENTIWLVCGGLLLIWQISGLLYALERITRDLTGFLEAIQYSDFTQSYRTPYPDKIFNSLYDAFTSVMDSFQETRSQSEAQKIRF